MPFVWSGRRKCYSFVHELQDDQKHGLHELMGYRMEVWYIANITNLIDFYVNSQQEILIDGLDKQTVTTDFVCLFYCVWSFRNEVVHSGKRGLEFFAQVKDNFNTDFEGRSRKFIYLASKLGDVAYTKVAKLKAFTWAFELAKEKFFDDVYPVLSDCIADGIRQDQLANGLYL
ncbi:hypothetical protein FNV43_RR05658 [Rhamnella rubrinervis]|uniref:Uncharacterized protein n=1 Tax=Rhamnella rubrinervis TaxID=2594499 RepID=A0A8K0MRU0_9ROSA|nr:hypothetical protein FNV43_RR05658 [Rhamnella rubrinervis]